jgi:hypothetical protein
LGSEGQGPGQELSVLDWFKSLLRLKPVPLPDEEEAPWAEELPSLMEVRQAREAKPAFRPRGVHFRLPLALLFALVAQARLELRSEPIVLSVALYVLAAVLAGLAIWAGDLKVGRPRQAEEVGVSPTQVRVTFLAAAAVLSLLTWITSENNLFRFSTVIFWFSAITCIVLALWEGDISVRGISVRLRKWWDQNRKHVRISTWSLLVLAVLGLSVYFRFAQLTTVPLEMWSDHAEKLRDLTDVLNGQTKIFFRDNTGREGMQFYLAAATTMLLDTGISFITLKIGTVLAGVLTLPYIYLFAREFGGRKVALAALFLAGVAYWPNTISRFGLRFPLYALFAAPAMYHLLRGLRLRQRNHLLLCGLFTGFGLHGYSPARVIPLVVVLGVVLFMLHRTSRGQRREFVAWLVACGLVALIVFLPLLRVVADIPEAFFYRMMTRVSDTERAFSGNPLAIFGSNVLKGLGMFGWDNGEIWAITLTHRPELDWVTGALFTIGVAITLVRYIRKRNWQDLFILISIVVLMLPSTLSIAFPNENPAPNRAIGAIVPVFTLAAIPLAAIPEWVKSRWKDRRANWIGRFVMLGLLMIVLVTNYSLTFDEFATHIREVHLNTSDAGKVIRAFAETTGTYDTAHVIPFPYWVDTRLVGIVAGQGVTDFATWPDELEGLIAEPRPQLFILHITDTDSLELLQSLFPGGTVNRWEADIDSRDFIIYSVPARLHLLAESSP